MSALTGFPVVVVCPVQWGEMDAYQHVNNVTYLRWFETGRAAYFDAAQLWKRGTPDALGPIFHSVQCRYRVPLTFPDDVEIGVRVVEVGVDRFTVEHAVFSRAHGCVAAEGRGVVVAYDFQAKTKALLPQAWLDAFARIEGRPFVAPGSPT
ncbi:MAG: acyl-CoA thioesterase [Myxococcota bacterium]